MTIEGIDLQALAEWMGAQGFSSAPISDVELLAGGTQNLLMRFRHGGDDLVLRRPPLNKRPNSDETMVREARVLRALADSEVPHARLVAACSDPDVLGAAFYIMDAIDGANPTVALPEPYVRQVEWRHALGLAMVDGLSAIAAVDHVAAGLDGLGKPEGFLERQVERWRSQLESYSGMLGYPGADLPHVQAVADWLEANRPSAAVWRPGLMHGDYHFANVLCSLTAAKLAAIVDWELTTIGDPLLDLGWLLATWPDDDDQEPSVTPWDGFPTPAELVARYEERTDRDLSAITWYESLACFKLGIVLEGTHARACAGLADPAVGDRLHERARHLLLRAGRRIAAA